MSVTQNSARKPISLKGFSGLAAVSDDGGQVVFRGQKRDYRSVTDAIVDGIPVRVTSVGKSENADGWVVLTVEPIT